MPAEVPAVTMPTASTVAMAGVELAQVPPGVALLSGMEPSMHRLVPPVMAAGSGFTVTVPALKHPEDNV